MARKGEIYVEVIVESFIPPSTAGRHGSVHIRPIPGQGDYTPDIYVSCSKVLSDTTIHDIGTKFRIVAKLTDRENGPPFLYSHPSWPVIVLPKDEY